MKMSQLSHSISIRDLLPNPSITGFDIVILSDLLHFDASHDALVKSLSLLLAKTVDARVYVAVRVLLPCNHNHNHHWGPHPLQAGKYTLPKVVSSFLKKATDAGLVLIEYTDHIGGSRWLGTLPVSGLDAEALGIRKNNCRFWVGQWAGTKVVVR